LELDEALGLRRGERVAVGRRLATLKKNLEQFDIYFKCKKKKPLSEAEQILFTTAKNYLKGVMRERKPHRKQDME
jgi:hypothetical protein